MKRILPLILLACMVHAQSYNTWTWDVDSTSMNVKGPTRNVPHGDTLYISPRMLDNGTPRTWPTNAVFIMKYQVESMVKSNLWYSNTTVSAGTSGTVVAVWGATNDFYVKEMDYRCWIGAYSNGVAVSHPIYFTMHMLVAPDWNEGTQAQVPSVFVFASTSAVAGVVGEVLDPLLTGLSNNLVAITAAGDAAGSNYAATVSASTAGATNAAHVAASDPHGDRVYAGTLLSTGTAAAALSAPWSGLTGTPPKLSAATNADWATALTTNGADGMRLAAALTNVPTAEQVGALPTTWTNGPVAIDAGNTKTNTYGGALGIGPSRWQSYGSSAAGNGSWANYISTASGGAWANYRSTATGAGAWANYYATANALGAWANHYGAAGGIGAWASYYANATAEAAWAFDLANATNDHAFAWRANSHGDGTFNLGPDGGTDGFYIGDTNLTWLLTHATDPNAVTNGGATVNGFSVSNGAAITLTAGDVGALARTGGVLATEGGDVVGTLNTSKSYTGVGESTNGAPRIYLGENPASGDDSAICIGRTLNGSNLFSHALRDESVVTSGGTDTGYASYDAVPTLRGSNHWNHYISFQSRPIVSVSTGNVPIYGFNFYPIINSTNTQVTMLNFSGIGGTGNVAAAYGIVIPAGTFSAAGDAYAMLSFDTRAKIYLASTIYAGAGITTTGSLVSREWTPQNDNNTVCGGFGTKTFGGFYGTALGYNAWKSFTAFSSHNTALGTAAGYSQTAGSRNTYLGAYAGYGVTSGSNNIAIGASAGFTQGAGWNDNLLITPYQSATAVAENTNALIVGKFSLAGPASQWLTVNGTLTAAVDAVVNGNLTIVNGNVYCTNRWEDLRTYPNGMNLPGAPQAATLEVDSGPSGDQIALRFTSAGTLEAGAPSQLPHSWVSNTTVYPHFHYHNNAAGPYTSVWQFAYSWTNILATFPSSTVVVFTNVDLTGGQYKHQLLKIPTNGISGAGKTASSVLRWRLSRLGGDAADTSGDIDVIASDMHYMTLGLPIPFTP